jgi:predicted enzyme related to lactoylglutathione lyase
MSSLYERQPAMIRKIKFISIPVRDQDRALDFYVSKLGFQLVTDQPMGPGQRWIEIRPAKGETGIALYTAPGHESRVGTFSGASFECDDVQKTYDELSGKGVTFAKPPEKQPWGTTAILKDSEGNEIVLSASR